MAKTTRGKSRTKQVETLRHEGAGRANNPTAEMQTFAESDPRVQPEDVRYARDTPLPEGERRARNPELDPQLVWRGKDEQDWSDLVTVAPPIYIQEKIHPKAIIDDLKRQGRKRRAAVSSLDTKPSASTRDEAGSGGESALMSSRRDSAVSRHEGAAPEGDDDPQPDLFADFNGLDADPEAKTEFYAHEQHWTNRMILGDSLQVMASLAEKEQYRGSVQCIYVDPPYGIKFNSNWQVSTRSRDVKDGKLDQVSREPEQIKAFRDTWKDGIHSYLTYLRDRLTVARDLLADSGSIFVQIGDENVHRVRALMDEVFGEDNYVSMISFRTTTGLAQAVLDKSCDYILWYAKSYENLKYRQLFKEKGIEDDTGGRYRLVQFSDCTRRSLNASERGEPSILPEGAHIFRRDNLTSQSGGESLSFKINFHGMNFNPGKGYWKTNFEGMERLKKADRLSNPTEKSIQYVRFLSDFPLSTFNNVWTDTQTGAFTDPKLYVVQTNTKVVQRCILMSTDPGDLVLDPTCGSGTAATLAEQWGRRWITIDTSRVALALARARLMGARYPYYLLADSPEGQRKEAELAARPPSDQPTHGDIRHGFVYKRVPHITLKAIANNQEIDVIWAKWQAHLEPLRARINAALGRQVPDVSDAVEGGPHAVSHGPHAVSPPKGERTQAAGAGENPSPPLGEKGSGGDPAADAAASSPPPGEKRSGGHATTATSPAGESAVGRVRGREAATRRDDGGSGADTPDGGLPPGGGEPALQEWELPREAPADWPEAAAELLAEWWQGRIARQQEIDAAIARNAEQEVLYDQPYEDPGRVRVAGPFTVESLSPHRVVPTEQAELWGGALDAAMGEGAAAASESPHAVSPPKGERTQPADAGENPSPPLGEKRSGGDPSADAAASSPPLGEKGSGGHAPGGSTTERRADFAQVVLDHLRQHGVQQGAKDDRIVFSTLTPWPGEWVAAEGRYGEGDDGPERRAAIFIGPEYGSVARQDLVRAAREAAEAGFDVLIACAFSFEAHASEFTKLGRLPVIRARMNPDLHMAGELKTSASGNLFVVFGEPDVRIDRLDDGRIQVAIQGLDIFDPAKGEVRAGGTDDIAAWFIDTDYDEESFFVRHAYFLGAQDPYKALKTALKAEIDEDAWSSLHRDTSRPFDPPDQGRIAVKVINHFGDEVMQVFEVGDSYAT